MSAITPKLWPDLRVRFGFKRFAAWVLLVLVGLAPELRAQSSGFIHVVCPPGVQVFLDNRPQGVTELKNEGLIIDDVRPGLHHVRLVREGFETQDQVVQVEEGQLADCRAGPFTRPVAPAVPVAVAPADGKTVDDLKLDLVWIRPGTFLMGSPTAELNHQTNEWPQTQVRITKGFWLGRTEITHSQYETIMNADAGELSLSMASRPMASVSWTEAKAFCSRLTERERAAGRLPKGYVYNLPTEAQWEYACRAGTKGAYAGNLDAQAWYFALTANRPVVHAVGMKQPNDWGLCDMQGNVSEWCLSCYVERLPGGVIDDPRGPLEAPERVVRGGAFDSPEELCRSAWRGHNVPGYRSPSLGFRVALVVP